MSILCKLGIHKRREIKEVVFKIDSIETINYTSQCLWCKRKFGTQGATHFGPVLIAVNKKNTNR